MFIIKLSVIDAANNNNFLFVQNLPNKSTYFSALLGQWGLDRSGAIGGPEFANNSACLYSVTSFLAGKGGVERLNKD